MVVTPKRPSRIFLKKKDNVFFLETVDGYQKKGPFLKILISPPIMGGFSILKRESRGKNQMNLSKQIKIIILTFLLGFFTSMRIGPKVAPWHTVNHPAFAPDNRTEAQNWNRWNNADIIRHTAQWPGIYQQMIMRGRIPNNSMYSFAGFLMQNGVSPHMVLDLMVQQGNDRLETERVIRNVLALDPSKWRFFDMGAHEGSTWK